MTTTLASSMLSVLVLTELLKNKKRIFQYGLVLCLILFTALEFDLFNLGKGTVSRNLSNAYEYIKNDTDNFAILELPSAYSETGDMGYLGNYYMFRQTQHGHSMVLGAPSRFLSQSLDFTNDTPVFYEFTHPWIFKRLENDKKLANIAQFITENGADLVRKNGIKYVLHHTRNNYFDEETKANTTEWLNKIYGDPILIDGEGINLYAVKSGG